jgi:hypothetical protein
VRWEIVGPDGKVLDQVTIVHDGPARALQARPGAAGWCVLRATGSGFGAPAAFTATVTYDAPQHFKA